MNRLILFELIQNEQNFKSHFMFKIIIMRDYFDIRSFWHRGQPIITQNILLWTSIFNFTWSLQFLNKITLTMNTHLPNEVISGYPQKWFCEKIVCLTCSRKKWFPGLWRCYTRDQVVFNSPSACLWLRGLLLAPLKSCANPLPCVLGEQYSIILYINII